MNSNKMIIFNGSPRKKGTSYSFARTLKLLAEEQGNTVDIVNIVEYFDKEKDFNDLCKQISHCDIIGLIAPLYVDTLPYIDIWFLERLYKEYRSYLKGKRFFAVGQSGFPDIALCNPLLEPCRLFADASEMQWMGGLAYGGGARLNGALMEDLGKSGEKITSAFKIVLEDIYRGAKISPKSQQLLTVGIPKFLYRPLAAFLNHMARKKAKKYGVTDLSSKVYLE